MSKDSFSPEMMERIRKRDPETLAAVDRYVAENGDCETSIRIREIAVNHDFDRKSFEAAVVFLANTTICDMAGAFDDDVNHDFDIKVPWDPEDIEELRISWNATGDDAVIAALNYQSLCAINWFQCEEKLQIARNVMARIIDVIAREMGVSRDNLVPTESGECLIDGGFVDPVNREVVGDIFDKQLETKMEECQIEITAAQLKKNALAGMFSGNSGYLTKEEGERIRNTMLTRINQDFTEDRIQAVLAEKTGASEHLRRKAAEQDAEHDVECDHSHGAKSVPVFTRVPELPTSELDSRHSMFTIVVDSVYDEQNRNLGAAMRKIVEEYPQFTVYGNELRATPEASEDLELIAEIKQKSIEVYNRWMAGGAPDIRLKTLADLMRED